MLLWITLRCIINIQENSDPNLWYIRCQIFHIMFRVSQNTILTQSGKYGILNTEKKCSEFCKNTKIGIFCLSQDLNYHDCKNRLIKFIKYQSLFVVYVAFCLWKIEQNETSKKQYINNKHKLLNGIVSHRCPSIRLVASFS